MSDTSSEARGPRPEALGSKPEYPLPRLVRVEWRRRDRMQHAVGFLVADTATHLVLSDRFDGKHPDSRRLWTIDHGDVVVREEVCGVAAPAHECRCWAGEEPRG